MQGTAQGSASVEQPTNTHGAIAMTEQKHKYEPRVAAIHRLRVNVKSLAAEARIIRQEERRAGPAYRYEMSAHRRGRLREEARYAQLALAFVRGKPYKSAEREA